MLQPLFRALLGLEGRLAADNLVRSPGRTGLVIAALAATAGLVVQTAGFIRSSEAALFEWVDETIAADLFVTAGSSADSAGLALPMDESLGRQARRRCPGWRSPCRCASTASTTATASWPSSPRTRPPSSACATTTPSPATWGAFPRLREPGTALVSENFAHLYQVRPGDRITFNGRRRPASRWR